MNGNSRISTLETHQMDVYAPFVPDEEVPYIFISYAHADRNRVFSIIKEIYEQGWHVWYDEGLLIGNETDYADQLAAHIRGCAIILVFITKEAVRREFVTKKELEFGINIAKKRFIVCILDKDAVIPDGIELLTANRNDFPRISEKEINNLLPKIKELKKFKSRKAIGFIKKSAVENITIYEKDDVFEFE